MAGHIAEKQSKELDGVLMSNQLLSLGLYMSIPGTCDSLVLRSVGIRNRGSENVQEGTLQKS